jgi:hypothetical protein
VCEQNSDQQEIELNTIAAAAYNIKCTIIIPVSKISITMMEAGCLTIN